MRGVGQYYSGEAVEVATIRKRRRSVSPPDAISIRDLKMLELHVDGYSSDAIGLIFCGLTRQSVNAGIRRAKAEVLRARRQASR